MASGPDLLVPFALFAGTIFVGVVAHRLFDRTGIPDILALLALGLVVGPALHLVDPAALSRFAPLVGAFALLIILLEGGLELNYHHVLEKARSTTLLTIASLVLTTAAVTLVAPVLGFPIWPHGLLLGLVLSPLSASVLIPMLDRLPIQAETRAILSLECSVGEGLAVIAVFAASEIALLGNLDLPLLLQRLLATFGLGIVVALVAGVLWIELLEVLGRTPYSYMVTLAAAVGLFAILEAIGGNGYIAVLAFGLVLSNAREISGHLPARLRTEVRLDETLRWMNTEVTFVVRTFYFVYLGVLLGLAPISPALFLFGLVLLVAIVAARLGAVRFLVGMRPEEAEDASYLRVLVPRGLASAVLASIPASFGLVDGPTFVGLVSLLIVLTNLTMTGGLLVLRRRAPPAPVPQAA